MTGRAVLLSAVWVVACGIAGTRAQDTRQPQPPATFRGGIQLVTLDVSVLDGARRPVRGLSAADFTVLEDGRAQRVTTFAAIDLPDRRAFAAPWMREVAPDVITNALHASRIVVILLDDFHISSAPADTASAQQIGRAIIDELGPDDVAAVAYTFNQSSGEPLTTDRTRLREAVDRFKSAAFASLGATPSSACPRGECVTATMKRIAEVLRGWPGGKKTLVYVSPQAPFNIGARNIEMPEGESASDTFEANVTGWDSGTDLAQTFAALQLGNIAVYQYDPRGLEESLAFSANPIGMFADSTGGRTFTRTNATWQRVPDMFDETSAYYLLGFAPDSPAVDGRLRRISVRVNRPGLSVRTRSGYYASTELTKTMPPAATRPTDRALPGGAVPLTLNLAPFAVTGAKRAALLVVAGADALAKAGPDGLVNITARAFDSQGRPQGTATTSVRTTHRAVAGAVHYDITSRLDLAPGRYEIRVALDHWAGGAAGTVYGSVTVPDFANAPLTLSAITVERGSDVTRLSSVGLPAAPTTARAFAQQEHASVFVRIYQGGTSAVAPTQVVTRLTNDRNDVVFETIASLSADDFDHARAVSYQRALPLARLEPGEYLLTIDATATGRHARRDVRFHVK